MARTARGTGKDNRQKILNSAAAIIAEKGVGKASLAEIARACGLSKGTLYYYYSSKDDLIFDIADRHMGQLTAAVFAMIDLNSETTMEMLLQAFFSTLLASEARSRLHLYLVREAVSGNAGLKERFQETYARWFHMVDQIYDRLGKPKADIPARARFLVAAADGFILQTLLEADPPPIEDIVRLVLGVMGD